MITQFDGAARQERYPLETIRKQCSELSEHWASEVADARNVAGDELALCRATIVSSTPAVITAMTDFLLTEDDEVGSLNTITECAGEFGLSRYRLGWSAEAVVEDLSRLRQCLLRQLLCADSGKSYHEPLGVFFDRVVAAAVGRYHRAAADDRNRWPGLDSVSGLANASHLGGALRREVVRADRYRHPIALIGFDLDGFSAINADLGRLRANEIIREVGVFVAKQGRASDLASRVRADEFAILMPGTDAAGAFGAAHRLRRSLAQASLGGRRGRTAAFGVSFLPDAQSYSCLSLVKRCRHAVMSAKAEGGDTVVVG